MFHGRGIEIVSQVDQFLAGEGIYKQMFDSATVTTVTNANKSPSSNTILSLKDKYSSTTGTTLVIGQIINRDILVRCNFRTTDICSGRFLYEQILILLRYFKKLVLLS